MRDIVKERNAKRVVVNFQDDETGEPVAVSTSEWRMDCLTNDSLVQDWTASTVQTITGDLGVVTEYRTTIAIPAGLNAIINDANKRELKKVSVRADRGLDTEFGTKVEYYVVNEKGRT
jgi:hypothetical protein